MTATAQGAQSARVLTIQDETADGWWARRRCAFAHPTESIFKQRHSQTRLRDLAAKVESARKEVPAVTPETPGVINGNPRQLDTSVGVSGPHDFAVRFKRVRPQRHQRPPHPASRP
jgi:hypothetical protein